MAALTQRIQLRRDTTANWALNSTVVLYAGEIGVELISAGVMKVKVGDGLTAWASLPYVGSNVGGGALSDNGDGTYTFTPSDGGASITFGGVSSDANNAVVLGADNKPFAGIATAAPPAVSTSGGSAGVSASLARADHTHAETLTSLAFDAVTKVVTYTDEAGVQTVLDLSALALDLSLNDVQVSGDNLVLTVSDGTTTNTITVSLAQFRNSNVGGSIVGDGNTVSLTLENDSATPGTSKYYGTDGAGAKGFHAMPVIPVAASAAPEDLDPSAAAVGTSAAFAREDHVHAAPNLLGLAGAAAAPAVASLVTVDAAGQQAYFSGIDGGQSATLFV